MNYTVILSSAFDTWLATMKRSDSATHRRIVARVARLETGNFGDCKALGDKVSELRLDFGPGYRVYFTIKTLEIVIVLGGGNKDSQDNDIKAAKEAVKSLPL